MTVRRHTQLALIEETCLNKDFEKIEISIWIISLFLLNMLLLAGLRAKFTAGGTAAMDTQAFHPGGGEGGGGGEYTPGPGCSKAG